MVDAVAPVSSRRLPLWVIIAAPTACVLPGVFVLLWFKLPTWAPAWVVEHSPWVDPIVRAVNEEEGSAHLERASELLIARGPAVIPHLIPWVQRNEYWGQKLVGSVFSHLQDDRIVEPTTVAILEWDEVMYPRHWVDALCAQDPTTVTDHILPHLVAGSLVRQALLDVAGRLPGERLIPALTVLMVQPGTWGTEDSQGRFRETAEVAAEALVNSPCPSAVIALVEAYTDGSVAIRRRVLDGIANGDWADDQTESRKLDQRLQQLLLAAMDDADQSVRCSAAQIMHLLFVSGADARLLTMSKSTDEVDPRCAIFGLHPKWHGEAATRRIVEALHDADDRVRLTAISVLRRIDQFCPTSELLDLLSSPNAEVRMAACNELYRNSDRNDPRLFPAFVKLMDDPVLDIFHRAHNAASFVAESTEMKKIVDEKFRARITHLNPFGSDE